MCSMAVWFWYRAVGDPQRARCSSNLVWTDMSTRQASSRRQQAIALCPRSEHARINAITTTTTTAAAATIRAIWRAA